MEKGGDKLKARKYVYVKEKNINIGKGEEK